jgi:N-acetylglucosamine-6-phosphate deacetylase
MVYVKLGFHAMTYTALSPLTATAIRVLEENGRIRSIEKAPDANPETWIAPGLIDIQVNGFAGVDYNSPGTPLDEIARSIREMRATGVTRFCPTVITGSNENICGSLRNLARARRELPEGASMCGFHVEGPWISALDGPRGAHPIEHVRAPSIEEFEQFQEAAEGNIRLLTLAPEAAGAPGVIEHLVENGVVVAIGHTAANEQQIRDAIRAGATMSTHLGNGSHAQVPRHDNYIIYQLAADELWASLIVDGIHLPPAFVKVAIRAKGVGRSILTTDAVPPAGCAPGIYRFGHLEVELTPGGRVELTDSRRLAGSALRMDRALGNLMRFAGLPLPDALKTATSNAARGIGLEGRKGFLQPGDWADFILFRFDPETQEVEVVETVVAAEGR